MANWIEEHPFVMALIASFIISVCGLMFHYYDSGNTDWLATFMWIPVYVSPIWAIAGFSHLTERRNS